MEKIAIINLKGGVGKSVTTCNLSVLLPAMTKRMGRCLVVDLDKQANTTKFFGRHDSDRPAVDQVLLHPEMAAECVQATDFPAVDLLASNMRLLMANRQILMDCCHAQQDRLARALAQLEDKYEWCLLDCPPDIDMATINAMCAADWAIVPCDCDEWALDGLDEIMEQLRSVKENFNPRLRLMGCLVTRYTRTVHAVETINQLKDKHLPMFASGIRQSTTVAAAKKSGLPVSQYARSSPAAADYKALAMEIVSIVDTTRGGKDHE